MDNRTRIIGMILAAVMVFSVSAFGQCPVLETFRDNFRTYGIIEANFAQRTYSDIFETVDTVTGTLLADWQGRFYITMPHQTVVSNGIVYWSYSVENEQVLVDTIEGMGVWDPLGMIGASGKMYSCRGQDTVGGLYRFDLMAVDSQVSPQEFYLYVDASGKSLERLEFRDENDSRVIVDILSFEELEAIKNYDKEQIPSEVIDSLFKFVVPPDIEVIYMP